MEDDTLIAWMIGLLLFLMSVLVFNMIFENRADEETTVSEPIHYFNQPAQCFDGYVHRPCEFLEHEQDI